MDWSNESYVRLYTRDTVTWKRLRWEGQTVLMHLIRKLDRAGVMDGVEDLTLDVSIMTGLPEDISLRGIESLIRENVFVHDGETLLMPNFLDAQETPKSDRQRQRELRERRRLQTGEKIEKSQNVTRESQNVTSESQNVTKSNENQRSATENNLLSPYTYTVLCSALPNYTVNSCIELEEKIFNSLLPKFGTRLKLLKPKTQKTLIENLSSDIYPGVDVCSEIKRAGVWEDSNPTKKKTARGLSKFLTGWMDRAQNNSKKQVTNKNEWSMENRKML